MHILFFSLIFLLSGRREMETNKDYFFVLLRINFFSYD